MTDGLAPVLDQLEAIGAEAASRAAEVEAARALPRDLVEGLIGGGVFQLAVTPSLGGVGADLATVVATIERTARHDGSLGWFVMHAVLAGLDAERLPRHHAEVIFGDARAVVGTVHTVGGRGRLTDDGSLQVTGRWPWASGAAASTWLGGAVQIVDDDDRPAPGPDGVDEVIAFFRRDQVVVLDTWHALGLRGTGSTDFEVTTTLVPEGRWIVAEPDATDPQPADPVGPAGTGHTGPSGADAYPLGVAAVALGLAGRAVEELAVGGPSPTRTRPVAQAELNRLEGEVVAATDHLLAVARRLDAVDRSPTGPRATDHDLTAGAAIRSAAVAAVNLVERAVDVVSSGYRLGGPDAVYHASPRQRWLRDVHTAAQHPAVAPERLAELGAPVIGDRD